MFYVNQTETACIIHVIHDSSDFKVILCKMLVFLVSPGVVIECNTSQLSKTGLRLQINSLISRNDIHNIVSNMVVLVGS